MSDTAVAEPTDELQDDALDYGGGDDYEYPIDVSDAGPGTKKVTVTVPRDRIEQKIGGAFAEGTRDVQLPGFRRGKAPKHLVRKKLGKAVRDQVQGEVIRESYQQALVRHKLAVIGEPEFEDAAGIELPEQGDMTYSFSVEVRPEFDLPNLSELTVRKPKITIQDEHVGQAMENLRQQQGAVVPVSGRPVQAGDFLVADVTVRADGEQVARQEDAQLVARGGKIAGIGIDDFGERVAGMNVGEERTIAVQGPDDAPSDKIRGRAVEIVVQLKDLKELQKAEIDEPFLESLGFENRDQLLEALREQMEERVAQDVQNQMRRQVSEFLAANTQFDVPAKMTARQERQVVNRRAMDLLMRGMPEAQVKASIDRIRQGADEAAKKELRTFFILNKAAEDLGVTVEEAEINGQIAALALEREERPAAIKAKMQKDGSLQNLYLATRERKTLDALLEQAKVEEFEPTPQEQQQAVETAATGEGEADEDGETEDVT